MAYYKGIIQFLNVLHKIIAFSYLEDKLISSSNQWKYVIVSEIVNALLCK